MSLQPQPTPIVPPQEPLKGRDPTLAARTMGEGNRVILPLPLVGHFDTERIPSVSFSGPVTISAEKLLAFNSTLAALLEYPTGEHEVRDHNGNAITVSVAERVRTHLTVGLETEDSPITHLATLLDRLKETSDEIVATVNATNPEYEPAVTECLLARGLRIEADFARAEHYHTGGDPTTAPSHVAVPYVFVWRK